MAQDAYDWNKPKPAEPISARDQELGPTPVAPRVQRPREETDPGAREAPAADLMAHLLETGTPPDNLRPAKRWMEETPKASSLDLYRYLEDSETRGERPINPGTLRKAGKWLWGASWEPDSAMAQTPSDEIKRLRETIANMERNVQIQNSRVASIQMELDYARQEVVRLQKENEYFRTSRSLHDAHDEEARRDEPKRARRKKAEVQETVEETAEATAY